MKDKYIKVSDLMGYLSSSDIVSSSLYSFIDEFVDPREIEMISVGDVEKIIKSINPSLSLISSLNRVKQELNDLINTKSKKSGGLTIKEWEQLKKLSYVDVRVSNLEGIKLLTKVSIDNVFKDGAVIELLPDLENTTRTNINIPDGIEVEYTWTVNDMKYVVKEITPKYHLGNWAYYRILGVAE